MLWKKHKKEEEEEAASGLYCNTAMMLLEQACIDTIESGTMTKDLAVAIHKTTRPPASSFVTTNEYMDAVEQRLRNKVPA